VGTINGSQTCDPRVAGTSYFNDTAPSVVAATPALFISDVPEPPVALVLAPGLIAPLLVALAPGRLYVAGPRHASTSLTRSACRLAPVFANNR
jgi:hypothetical protein